MRTVIAITTLIMACARPFPMQEREQNFLSALLLYAGFSSCSTPAFSGIRAVDTPGNMGMGAAIAVSRCVIYITYLDNGTGNIKLARSYDGGNSFVLSVVGPTGTNPSIAVSGSTVHIAYFFTAGADLRYARSTDGGETFTAVTLDSVGSVGDQSSVAVAGSNVYIAYYDSTSIDLKLAKSTDSGST
ncbi:MAG TPA: sialidase family protein, partial [Leptospiraceae bacterium]|nr:sialidase family protein [Leptospiraceae bacterium]